MRLSRWNEAQPLSLPTICVFGEWSPTVGAHDIRRAKKMVNTRHQINRSSRIRRGNNTESATNINVDFLKIAE